MSNQYSELNIVSCRNEIQAGTELGQAEPEHLHFRRCLLKSSIFIVVSNIIVAVIILWLSILGLVLVNKSLTDSL